MNGRPAAGALGTGLTGAALTVIALAIGTAPLLVAGIGLIVVALGATAIVLPAARRVRVSRRLPISRIQEGDPLDAVLVVHRGRLRFARLEIRDPLLAAPVSVAAGTREIPIRGVAPRRGRHRLVAPEVAVSDPLGLLYAVRAGQSDTELIVLPRLEPVRWGTTGPGGLGTGATPGSGAGSEPLGAGEIDGLRPYRSGTPASRIHWPALARGAGLLERQVRPSAEGWPLIALDLRGAAGLDELDAAVRAAASLTAELARRGGVRLWLPGDRRASAIGPDLAAWPDAHLRLALVGGSSTAGRAGARGIGAPSTAGAGGERLFLVRASAALPVPDATRQATIIVLPAGAPGLRPSPVLTVGGCRGYDLSRRAGGRVAA